MGSLFELILSLLRHIDKYGIKAIYIYFIAINLTEQTGAALDILSYIRMDYMGCISTGAQSP